MLYEVLREFTALRHRLFDLGFEFVAFGTSGAENFDFHFLSPVKHVCIIGERVWASTLPLMVSSSPFLLSCRSMRVICSITCGSQLQLQLPFWQLSIFSLISCVLKPLRVALTPPLSVV